MSVRRGSATRVEAGASYLEVLVALACTSLLAAAVLPLVVGGSRVGRDRMERVESGSIAAAAAAAVAADLARLGVGLEGATAARRAGLLVPLVDSSTASGSTIRVTMLLAGGDAVEVAGLPTTGPYRAIASGGLVAGDPVAAIGSPGASAGDAVPLGEVMDVVPDGSAGVRILVAFSAPEAAHLQAVGAPRALVPVTFREYGTRPGPEADRMDLWRRDDAGPRQPVAEGLDGFRVDFHLDRDGDGVAEDGPWPTLAAAAGGSGAFAQVRAVRVAVTVARPAPGLGGDASREALVWAGVGGPA